MRRKPQDMTEQEIEKAVRDYKSPDEMPPTNGLPAVILYGVFLLILFGCIAWLLQTFFPL